MSKSRNKKKSKKSSIPDFNKKFPKIGYRNPIAETFHIVGSIEEIFIKVRGNTGKKEFWDIFKTCWDEKNSKFGDKLSKEFDKDLFDKDEPDANYILIAAIITIAYVVDTMKAYKANKELFAWHYACRAHTWFGFMLSGINSVPYHNNIISNFAKKGAMASHAENHAMRKQVQDWYGKLKGNFKSMSKAAETAFEEKLVPVTHRTLYEWIREFNKNLPSASKL